MRLRGRNLPALLFPGHDLPRRFKPLQAGPGSWLGGAVWGVRERRSVVRRLEERQALSEGLRLLAMKAAKRRARPSLSDSSLSRVLRLCRRGGRAPSVFP